MNQMNTMNENENKKLKDSVLEKIETGKINMKPRFYFVAEVTALIVVAILTLLTSSLLVSFIIFSLIASGKLFLLGFGVRGLLTFFVLFPWSLLIVEIIFIILLEWLIKKFKFGYRSSLTRLVFVILLISIALSVVIIITPFHNILQNRAEQRNLPIIGSYYRGLRRPIPDQEIFRGVVSNVGTSSFVIDQSVDVDDNEASNSYYLIDLPPNVPSSFFPSVGDTVFVAGKLTSYDTVEAYGIQKFSTSDIQ